MNGATRPKVIVAESGNGPCAQFVTAGHDAAGVDEFIRLGEHAHPPTPYEFILAALGASTAMTLRMHATRNGWPVEWIFVELRHEQPAAELSAGRIARFERVIHLVGDLTDEQKAMLLEIADRCPVSQTLQQPSAIVSRIA